LWGFVAIAVVHTGLSSRGAVVVVRRSSGLESGHLFRQGVDGCENGLRFFFSGFELPEAFLLYCDLDSFVDVHRVPTTDHFLQFRVQAVYEGVQHCSAPEHAMFVGWICFPCRAPNAIGEVLHRTFVLFDGRQCCVRQCLLLWRVYSKREIGDEHFPRSIAAEIDGQAEVFPFGFTV
jgi:hypothetical protein